MAGGCSTLRTRSVHPDMLQVRTRTPCQGSHPTASDERATCCPSRAEKARGQMQQIRSSLGLKLCVRCTRLGRRLQHAHETLCTPRHAFSANKDATSRVSPSNRCAFHELLNPWADKAREQRRRMRSFLGVKLCVRCARLGRRLQHAQDTLCTLRHAVSANKDAMSRVSPNSIR